MGNVRRVRTRARSSVSPELTSVRRIPLAQPSIGPRERELVDQVLTSGILALGPFARDFEDAVASVAGRGPGVACSSGTAGLHMIVRALEIGEGDEVITTPFSFVASANCLLYERADPALRRHRGGQPGPRPGPGRRRRRSRTKGILPVHVFGRPCRIEPIASLADAPRLARSSRTPARRSDRDRRATARARTASPRSLPSTRTSRSRPARAASS